MIGACWLPVNELQVFNYNNSGSLFEENPYFAFIIQKLQLDFWVRVINVVLNDGIDLFGVPTGTFVDAHVFLSIVVFYCTGLVNAHPDYANTRSLPCTVKVIYILVCWTQPSSPGFKHIPWPYWHVCTGDTYDLPPRPALTVTLTLELRLWFPLWRHGVVGTRWELWDWLVRSFDGGQPVPRVKTPPPMKHHIPFPSDSSSVCGWDSVRRD